MNYRRLPTKTTPERTGLASCAISQQQPHLVSDRSKNNKCYKKGEEYVILTCTHSRSPELAMSSSFIASDQLSDRDINEMQLSYFAPSAGIR